MRYGMRLISLILLLFLCATPLYSGHDFDLRGEVVLGESEAGDNSLSESDAVYRLKYFGKLPVSETFSFILNEEIDAVTSATLNSPLSRINHPVNIHTDLGIEYTGLGRMQLLVHSQALFKSKEVDFPVFNNVEDSTGNSSHILGEIIQRHRENIDLFWEIPFSRLHVSANLLYTNLSYDYYRLGEKFPNQNDADLWVDAGLGVPFLKEKLWIRGAMVMKNDLNSYDGYNFLEGTAGGEWNFKLYKKRFRGTGTLFGRYYQSTIMEDKEYADGLGGLADFRLYYRVKPRFYIKGDLEYEMAPAVSNKLYVNQRYELSVRKEWKSLSAIESGYWMTIGSLVPRQCGYVNGSIAINPKLDIVPGVRCYLRWNQIESWDFLEDQSDTILVSDGKMKYYRTDVECDVRYRLKSKNTLFFKHFALCCGARYQWFRNLPSYVSSLRFYLGMTNYL